ncbi:MAG: aspartate aminotransferase, partial [Candidatus Omnitrophica bacterium CG12_big_fil_rev_8_21_14_0_65_50_5]
KDIYDLTITVNGVSKAYAMTGWRIGYAAGPEAIMEQIKKLQDHSTSNPASISQAAALQALKEPPEKIKAMVNEFRKRRDLICAELDRIPKVSYVRPEGAFYVFCDFSKVGPSEQIAKQILDDVNVALIPGEGFGAPGYMRLSFATSCERIQEGIRRIAEWIKAH